MSSAEELKITPERRTRRLVLILVAIAVVLALYGIGTRIASVSNLAKEASDTAIPRVQMISPKPAPESQTLTLPAEIEAWYQAPIYAQVSGYVSTWLKDYGAPVKRNDPLAKIETPALDAQYAAAKANLEAVKARAHLADVTAERWSALSGTEAVSQQDVDVKRADALWRDHGIATHHQIDHRCVLPCIRARYRYARAPNTQVPTGVRIPATPLQRGVSALLPSPACSRSSRRECCAAWTRMTLTSW